MKIDKSDLLKIFDCLENNSTFHVSRDRMNSKIHLASETRYSPITSETLATRDRVARLLDEKDNYVDIDSDGNVFVREKEDL